MIFLIIFNLFNTLSGVVIDAIMVIYAIKDPEYGYSYLQTLHKITFSFGGIFGYLLLHMQTRTFAHIISFRFTHVFLYFTLFSQILIEEITVGNNFSVWNNIIVNLSYLRSKIVLGGIFFLIISRVKYALKQKIDFLSLYYSIF